MASVNFAVYCACAEGRQSLLALEQYDDLTVINPLIILRSMFQNKLREIGLSDV
jgi:hypothetical protein